MVRLSHAILWSLIAVGVAAGGFVAMQRHRVEAANRRVEVAVDFGEVQLLADAARLPVSRLLGSLREAGVTSAAVTEDTLATLAERGQVAPFTRAGSTLLRTSGPELAERIARGLAERGFVVERVGREVTPGENLTFVTAAGSGTVYRVQAAFPSLRMVGVGLDPAAVRQVHEAGLECVARIWSFPGADARTMGQVLQSLAPASSTVVFAGMEVFGWRGKHEEAAAAFRASGLRYGQIEFGKQRGDDRLGSALKGEYIRVHSISEGEMAQVDEREAVDRFARAARERNIRLLYVRMLTFAGEDAVAANLAYLRRIESAVARRGEMAFGPARLFSSPSVPVWAPLLAAAAIGAAAGLLLGRLLALSAVAAAGMGFAGAAAAVLLTAFGDDIGRKLVALAAACVFPTMACLRRELLDPPVDAGRTRAVAMALWGLLAISAVSFAGALCVVALFSSLPFLMRADQFSGIKLAHAVPVLAIAAVAAVGLPKAGEGDKWRGVRERWRAMLDEPVKAGLLLAGLIALLVLAFALARTGNEPATGVSGLELKFRALLDRVLPVRPRTKEFLFGHPLMALGLGLWWLGGRTWGRWLLVAGVIGQVSLLNTFCHFHTPLWLSFVRAASGLVLGGMVGAALVALAGRRRAGGPGAEPHGGALT